MKLLILPSHRLVYYHHKMLLTLLPETIQAQSYTTLQAHHHHNHHNHEHHNQHNHHQHPHSLVATLHYKNVNIYESCKIKELAERILQSNHNVQGHKLVPMISEVFNKKIQVLDMYHTQGDKQTTRQCLISDKFGDLYKIPIGTNTKSTPIYINSNLGIPKQIKHLALTENKQTKQYILLTDEQNRIKIYNSLNPHELISVWFMINMTSIQCQLLKSEQDGDFIVLLVRLFNKVTLESKIQVHYFAVNTHNLEKEEYPGKQVKNLLNISQSEGVKYYTLLQTKINNQNAIILFYLFDNKILYEVFRRSGAELKSEYVGQVNIEEGKWDYLYGVDTGENNTVILVYGCDVEMPLQIKIQDKELLEGKMEGVNRSFSMLDKERISLNKYQKLVKLQLKL